MTKRFAWVLWLISSIAPASMYGQGWALPARTPNTPVSCATCPGQGNPNGQTVGYTAPITAFSGRFLDSQFTSDWQIMFRTGRAWNVVVAPGLKRVYMRIGSSVFAYSLDTFFKRLEAGEPMMPASDVPTSPGNNTHSPEYFLKWDEWFYPEWTHSGWQIDRQDGQDRIQQFDYDDQGYVYIAAREFGWGIVKDGGTTSGNMMLNQSQQTGVLASTIMSVKNDNGYYAIVTTQGAGTGIWDVTNRKAPTRKAFAPFNIRWFAKTLGGNRIAVIDQNQQLSIYDSVSIVTNAPPITKIVGTQYLGATSDGMNFFTAKKSPAGMVISMFSPSGAGYVETEYPVGGSFIVANLQYGDGYLTMTGLSDSGWDVRLFKVQPSSITEMVMKSFGPSQPASYFAQYYSQAPAGFVAPTSSYINITDGTVVRSAEGKVYLIVCAKGLGDVYQLEGGPSIAVTNGGSVGTRNLYVTQPPTTKIFPGDPVRFTASSNSVPTVTWDFGNPGAVDNAVTLPTGNATHQYLVPSGAFTGPGRTFVTRVSASAANVVGSVENVTLQFPTAQMGVSHSGLDGSPASTLLFAQPNATSPAVIVGDSFVDLSDGSVESHYGSWSVGGVAKTLLPSEGFRVNACGNGIAALTSHYGPYSGVAGACCTALPGLDVTVPTLPYTAKPFVAAIGSPTATNKAFRSLSRFANGTDANSVSWRWELLPSLGSVPVKTYASKGLAIPNWPLVQGCVDPSCFDVTSANMRVRLTIDYSGAPVDGTCAGMVSDFAESSPLNAPSFSVNPASPATCTSPCTFSVIPDAGTDPVREGWTYNWQVSGSSGTASAASSTDSTFVPSFTQSGNYTIKVTVSNGLFTVDSLPVTTAVTVNNTCGAMSASTVFAAALCATANCQTNEQVQFDVQTYGYSFNCAHHDFTWNFGPGEGSATTQNPKHSYSTSGPKSATVTITNAYQTLQRSVNFTVSDGGVVTPPQTGCGVMSNQTIYLAANCATNSCKNNETIYFDVQPFGYSFSCGQHNFSWTFSDGQTAQGQKPTHSFASSGPHTATVTITGPSQTFQRSIDVVTSDGTTVDPGPGTNTCGVMSTASIFPAAFCANGACNNNDSIQFDVQTYGYNFTCAQHDFSWDFGDGGKATGQNPTHAYATSGKHTATVTVTNKYQVFSRSVDVTTVDGNKITVPVTVSVTWKVVATNTVQLNGKFDPADGVGSWKWQFGDTTQPVVQNAGAAVSQTHAYDPGKSYTVTLTAYSGANGTGQSLGTTNVTFELSKRRAARH